MKRMIMLFFMLSLFFPKNSAEAKIISDSLYEIPKTKIPPVIDGKEDAVWKTIDWNFQTTYTVGDPPVPTDSGANLSGMSKALWDDDNLYILFYTIDDVIVTIPDNPTWNQDAITICIDGDNSKIPDMVAPDPGGGLAPGDILFTIPRLFIGVEDANIGKIIGVGTIDTIGIKFRIRDMIDTEGFPGWMLEMKIPLANLGIDASSTNQLIGWELEQDECDDAIVGRKGMSKWWHSSNYTWTNASIWGTAILSNRTVDTLLEIKKAPQGVTITIDGVLDPVYKLGNPVTTNVFRVGDPPGNDAVNTDPIFGGFMTVYPLWDDNYYYVFFDVVDAVITNIPANPGWHQDGIEFFIDADNSKNKDGVSPDPGPGLAIDDFQVIIPNLYKGNEDANIANIGLPPSVYANTLFRIIDKPDGSGYCIELRMRLDDLGIDTTIGHLIGFEFQMDNSNDAAAGRQGMEKWWHQSNNSWTDASLWGTAYLGTVTGTPPPADPTLTANPNLLSVIDVPNDQGGLVTLTWKRSLLDTNTTSLPKYTIWRAAPSNASGDTSGMVWQLAASQPTYKFNQYKFTVSTLYNATPFTDGKHYFIVTAQTSDSAVFYHSNIVSGYSVDNLSPLPPQGFIAKADSGKIKFQWEDNVESDLQQYNLYRSTSSIVNPKLISPYAVTTLTSFTDTGAVPNTRYYYRLCAQDINGNISTSSNEISLIVTGMEKQISSIPDKYTLEQNFPNPFNPSTTIRYGIPAKSKVTLQIYNVLGQMIAELVNSEQDAGWYTVVWNASVASGLYFYRMVAESNAHPVAHFVRQDKMLLVK